MRSMTPWKSLRRNIASFPPPLACLKINEKVRMISFVPSICVRAGEDSRGRKGTPSFVLTQPYPFTLLF